jgi:hypothetical protein
LSNPGRKLALLDLALEAGELQVGMGVDQAREYDCLGEFLVQHVGRSGDARVRANLQDPAVTSDQQSPVFYRRAFNRD